MLIDRNINSFLISGGVTFAAAKFVFDASTVKALIVGAVVGGIAVAIISIKLPQPAPVQP